MRALSPKR